MKKIIIWGAGGRSAYYLENHYFDENKIVCFVDSDPTKQDYMGCPVYTPSALCSMLKSVDYLVICSKDYLEILKQCIRLKLDWDKIVLTDNRGEALCKEGFERLKEVSHSLYKNLNICKYIHTKRNEYDLIDEVMRISRGRYADEEYIDEYFRFRTFELLAAELKRKNVRGAVAELGVFKGVFSVLINDIFEDRKIYLFDTFEGFDEKEAEYELKSGRCDETFIEAHKQSGEETVKKNLLHPEQAVVCKGYFPASIPSYVYNEHFAFASIDVDFEESTYQGIKFFYPRLSEGGALFIHDYHTSYLEGVEIAIRRYEKDMDVELRCVPIADRAGTLIVLK